MYIKQLLVEFLVGALICWCSILTWKYVKLEQTIQSISVEVKGGKP